LVPVSIEEATMAIPSKTPLKSDDFPLHVDGDQIKGQDGKPIAKAKNPGDCGRRYWPLERRRRPTRRGQVVRLATNASRLRVSQSLAAMPTPDR
jgi:hypothetical protein